MNAPALSQILGDYAAFYALQAQRLRALGIEVAGYAISHLAFRTATLAEYLVVRQQLEIFCVANVENVWNGRPISKLLLQTPLPLAPGVTTALIELIPPVHQSVYQMGLEHIGFVVGEAFAAFGAAHASKFTGQQDQGPFCQPYFITFPDHTNVKFYRHGLQEVCEREGKHFDGFYHEVA